MPTFNTAPGTHAIGNAIVSYLTALTYSDGITRVYTLAQLEQIKDITDKIANNTSGAPTPPNNGVVVEVYCNLDKSERRGFGGRIWDTQTWFILSMCSLDTPAHAAQIMDVRDALVQPFQVHAQLGNAVSNLFQSQLLETAKFGKIYRNGQEIKMYLTELETKQEWVVPTPPGITA